MSRTLPTNATTTNAVLRHRFRAWSREIDAVLGATRARRAGDRRLAQGLEEVRQKRDRVANKLHQLDHPHVRTDRAVVRAQMHAAYAELERAWSSLLLKLRTSDPPASGRERNERVTRGTRNTNA